MMSLVQNKYQIVLFIKYLHPNNWNYLCSNNSVTISTKSHMLIEKKIYIIFTSFSTIITYQWDMCSYQALHDFPNLGISRIPSSSFSVPRLIFTCYLLFIIVTIETLFSQIYDIIEGNVVWQCQNCEIPWASSLCSDRHMTSVIVFPSKKKKNVKIPHGTPVSSLSVSQGALLHSLENHGSRQRESESWF